MDKRIQETVKTSKKKPGESVIFFTIRLIYFFTKRGGLFAGEGG